MGSWVAAWPADRYGSEGGPGRFESERRIRSARRLLPPFDLARAHIACVLLSLLVLALANTSSAFGSTLLLGSQTVSSSKDNNSAGLAESFQATASASGVVGSLSVYVDSPNSASRVAVGLYSDSGGTPGTLLTQGTITSPTAGAWNTVTVSGASVTAGTAYWISVLSPSGTGTFDFRDAASGSLSENSSQTNLTTLPATWSPGPKWDDSPISAYASAATVTGPVLSATPSSLEMSTTTGGATPQPATVSVSNTGTGSLSFSASSDESWLTVSPTTGSAPQNLTVSASIASLAAGTYTGHITITATGAQGSPEVIPVTLNVNAPTGVADWPTIEHDLGRSGTATSETELNTGNIASLAQTWSTVLDGKVTAQPLFLSGVQIEGATHNVVIAATNQNTVYALDATSGAILWSRHLLAPPPSCGIPGGFGISGTPVVDRTTGRIYAVTDDGTLHTLSLADGSDAAPSLQFVPDPATNYVWSGLTLFNGSLYIPTASNGCDQAPWQGGIYQIGVTGAAPQLLTHWIAVPSLPASTAGGGIWGYGGVSIDTTNDHIYAASGDDATGLSGDEGYTPYAGSLLALDDNLNLLGWYQPTQPSNYNCGGAPPCDQDFASTPLVFHPSGCPTMLAAGSKNGVLYVTSESNLEADNGANAANVQAIDLNLAIDDLGEGGLSGTPAYSPATNLLYVVDTGPGVSGVAGGLVALSVQPNCSLQVAWSQKVGTAISNSPNSTPTLANGVVYVGVNNGSVSAFNAATGAPLWNSGSYGFAVYAAPIVANGELIAGSWNGAGDSDAGTIRAWTAPTSPVLSLNPTSLSFSATAGGAEPSAQPVTVSNKGVGSLSFTAVSNASWLSVTSTGGTAPATLSVQPNITALATGTHTTTITVTPSSGAAQNITVTLTVNPASLTTLLGDGNVEATHDNDAAGTAEAFSTTATASGTMAELRVYVDQGNAATALVAGLYTNASGHPAQLLTQGTLSKPVAGAWNTITVPGASVTSGTAYWIAVLGPAGSGILNYRDRSGGATSETSASTTLSALPAMWTTGATWSSSNLSATGLG